ncbi:hypothetical protein G6M86_07215 [Agrobacterium tumefaciens]|uniref:DUF551 domain-containing protein n=1 Tax=Agrobacterium tumefaciens TaxID=358 RepID=A0AAJ4N1R1_AGRTU|nr:hypothetical protein G6M86_07215 [Agrobacterium tumefaciens]
MRNQKLADLLHQYFELGVAEGREGRNHDTEAGDAQRVLSEIEAEIAALSTGAEPVMFISEKQLGCIGQYLPTRKEAEGNFQLALYRAPPAPSVAVKVLEWEAHGEGWRGCGSIIYDVYPVAEGEGWWAALSMAGYLPFRERCKSPEQAKAAAQDDYEARIRSALSAQVQDVAGWQSMDTAPKDGTRILIWFVHPNARFSKDPVAEGWAAAHEAYWTDHNRGGWTWHGLCGAPTLWQHLPAPPVDMEALSDAS